MKSGSIGALGWGSLEVDLFLFVAGRPDILWALIEKICNNAFDLWIRDLHRVIERCGTGVAMVAGKLSHGRAFFNDGGSNIRRVPILL